MAARRALKWTGILKGPAGIVDISPHIADVGVVAWVVLRARLFFLWGVWPEVRGERESGDFSQLSVFSVGMLSEPMRVLQAHNCVIRIQRKML